MKKIGLSVSMLAAAAFALAACGKSGPPITNQQQAGAAAMGAGNAANSTNSASGSVKGVPLSLLEQAAVSASGTASANCAKGGKVTASIDVNAGSTSGNITENVTFDGCTIAFDDPSTATVETNALTYDGSLAVTIDYGSTGTSGSLDLGLKGTVDLSGAFGDTIDVNLQMSASGTSGTGQVSLTGTVQTNEQSYTFDATVVGGSTRVAPRG